MDLFNRLNLIREHKFKDLCGFLYNDKDGNEFYLFVVNTPYSNTIIRHCLNEKVSTNFKYVIFEDVYFSCVYTKRQLLEYVMKQMDDIEKFKTFIENVNTYD